MKKSNILKIGPGKISDVESTLREAGVYGKILYISDPYVDSLYGSIVRPQIEAIGSITMTNYREILRLDSLGLNKTQIAEKDTRHLCANLWTSWPQVERRYFRGGQRQNGTTVYPPDQPHGRASQAR